MNSRRFPAGGLPKDSSGLCPETQLPGFTQADTALGSHMHRWAWLLDPHISWGVNLEPPPAAMVGR